MNMHNYKLLRYKSASFLNREVASFKLDSLNTHFKIEPQSGIGSDDMHNLKSDIAVLDHDQQTEGSTMRSTNDAIKINKTIGKRINIPRALLDQPDDGSTPTIKQYLAKPFLLFQGDLAATDLPTTFNDFLTSDALITNSVYNEKLKGVMSLRYTTVVTLQVNANKFQQGRYILGFVPTGGMRQVGTSPALQLWKNMHRANKTQITQLHHVEIDINKSTEVQLTIPYQGAFSALAWEGNLGVTTFGDPGYFFMYPYSPLKSAAGSTVAGYSLWVHYEDVETFGNTAPTDPPAPVQAQMSWNPRKSKRSSSKLDIGGIEMDTPGPVSKGLKLVSEGTDALTSVPLLASVAGPVSWATDMLSKAAYYAGWSKPRINKELVKISRFPHANIANYDIEDDTQPLALSAQNRVEVLPGFASTDFDELSIDYLKSIPSYISTTNWSLTTPKGTSIFFRDLSPTTLRGPDVGTKAQHTTVSIFTTMFARYTGGLKFHIKFVKTEFHTGRVMFAFSPRESSVIPTPYLTYPKTAYIHKTILDIRENSEFVVEVPYVSILPWRVCGYNSDQTHTNPLTASYGEVNMYVLDELVAPDTVTNNIDVLVEVSGMDDLRYSVPIGTPIVPVLANEMQMGDILPNVSTLVIDSNNVGGTQETNDSIIKDTSCVGEVVTSLRALLRRGGHMGFTNASSATTQNINILPFAWRAQPDPLDAGEVTYDIYGLLSSMYSLQRGGVRLRSMVTSAAGYVSTSLRFTGPDEAARTQMFKISNTSSSVFIDDSAFKPLAVQLQQLGGVGVEVPYYHYNHSTPSASQMITATSSYNFNPSTGSNAQSVDIQYQPAVNFGTSVIYRSGGDDCNFGGFVSIPLTTFISDRA